MNLFDKLFNSLMLVGALIAILFLLSVTVLLGNEAYNAIYHNQICVSRA